MEPKFVFAGLFLRAYELFAVVPEANQFGLKKYVGIRIGNEGLEEAHETQGKHDEHLVFALGFDRPEQVRDLHF